MSDESNEPSSPTCLAHEADDAYMGFATPAEVTAFLEALAEAERMGHPVGDMVRRMLPKLRDDALHRRLSAKLGLENREESIS